MKDNVPGLALMGCVIGLWGAMVAMAWYQDTAKHHYEAPRSEFTCDRLDSELKQQVRLNLIARDKADAIMLRCHELYRDL